MFLILIDVHSKWIEAFPAPRAMSGVMMDELSIVFARFSVPETIVTDNVSCLISEKFRSFLKNKTSHFCPVSPHI